MAHFPGNVAALHVEISEIRGGFRGARVLERGHALSGDFTVTAFVEFLFLAAADKQQALTGNIRDVVQQQRLPGFAVEIAAAEEGANGAAREFVDLVGYGRELARFENTYHNATAALFFGCTAFDNIFHADSLYLFPSAPREVVVYFC